MRRYRLGLVGGSGEAPPCHIFPRLVDRRRLYVVSLTIDFGRGGVSEGLWGEGVFSSALLSLLADYSFVDGPIYIRPFVPMLLV